jgi:hypothetical protein
MTRNLIQQIHVASSLPMIRPQLKIGPETNHLNFCRTGECIHLRAARLARQRSERTPVIPYVDPTRAGDRIVQPLRSHRPLLPRRRGQVSPAQIRLHDCASRHCTNRTMAKIPSRPTRETPACKRANRGKLRIVREFSGVFVKSHRCLQLHKLMCGEAIFACPLPFHAIGHQHAAPVAFDLHAGDD